MPRGTRLVLLLASFIVLFAGCDETFSPFVEDDRYFTLFGYLDTASEQQLVRVVPLRTTFGDLGSEELDIEVRTTELGSGNVTVWRDSVITFSDGSIGHVFIGDMQPLPGWTYLLEVESADGKISSATTTVPVTANVDVQEVSTGGAVATQRIVWDDIPIRPFRVEVWYRFLTSPARPFDHGVLIYGSADSRVGQSLEDDQWAVSVALSEDREDALKEAGLPGDAEPFLLGVGMRLTMTDDGWRPADGVFDRNVLVQPGVFSNVENGFGFFGAVNHYTIEWTIPDPIIEMIGYRSPR